MTISINNIEHTINAGKSLLNFTGFEYKGFNLCVTSLGQGKFSLIFVDEVMTAFDEKVAGVQFDTVELALTCAVECVNNRLEWNDVLLAVRFDD